MYVNCTRIPATRDYVLLARASLHGEVLRLKESITTQLVCTMNIY